MRRLLFLTGLLTTTLCAEVPPLLEEVTGKLTDERQYWAFTQHVRETGGDGKTTEREERYDPSRGDARRWLLLSVDGRTPTPQEVEDWSARKNKHRKKTPKTVSDYVDLNQARVQEENEHSVSYVIPLRSAAGGLFPGHKVEVILTINKQRREIERAQAGIDGPFNVALGLAKIEDLDFDLEVPAARPTENSGAKAEKPTGTASAVVNKLGRRVEYTWSDFTRVGAPTTP